MYSLHLDSSVSDRTTVSIWQGEAKVDELVFQAKAQSLMRMIEILCQKRNIPFSELGSLKVTTGPKGSFTGLRVGVSVAKALGYILDITVNGTKQHEQIVPTYEASKFDA